MTTSGGCVSLDHISGVVNITDGKCANNAELDERGVCFCPIGFIESKNSEECFECTRPLGGAVSKDNNCECHPYADAVRQGDEITCTCMSGFTITSSNECIKCDEIRGLVDAFSGCNCIQNALIDTFGVCVCQAGFIEYFDGQCVNTTLIETTTHTQTTTNSNKAKIIMTKAPETTKLVDKMYHGNFVINNYDYYMTEEEKAEQTMPEAATTKRALTGAVTNEPSSTKSATTGVTIQAIQGEVIYYCISI